MNPFRLRIIGTAGCGKSLFASRFLNKEFIAGKNVLLVCFNRPLADRLKGIVGDTGTVNTFNGFCDDVLKSIGQKLDYSSTATDPEFWQKVQDQVIAAEINDEQKFDSLIIDEGQDFEQEWFEILRLFTRSEANILWLEDRDQNLKDNEQVTLDNFVTYHNNVNYRSPESIAKFIRDKLPIEFEQGNDLPGLGVEVHQYKSAGQQPKIVGGIVQRLMRQGFSAEDIVVITSKGINNSVFSNLDNVGGITIKRLAEGYSDGYQNMTDGRLLFESIYRFKGHESPAVILVDVEPNIKNQTHAERLLYCAMTRATVRLEMVVSSDNEYNQRFVSYSV